MTMQMTLFDYATLDTETRIVVQQEDKEFDRNMGEAGTSFIRACHNLKRIHEALRYKRPGFVEYCQSKQGMSERTAYKMIDVAKMFAVSANISLQSKEAIYLLAAPSTPESARAEALERASAGENITHKAAQAIVNGHKEGTWILDNPATMPPSMHPNPLYRHPELNESVPFDAATDDEFWAQGSDDKWNDDVSEYGKQEVVQAVKLDRNQHIMRVMGSSESPEWYTPTYIVDRVIQMFGAISVDPCSNSKEAPNVPAQTLYTKDDNGLTLPWYGNVYMNPPYGDEIGPWIQRMVGAYQDGEINQAIALLPARIDTVWFQPLYDYPMCNVRGRIKFQNAQNSAPFPCVIVYLGENEAAFIEAFKDFGPIMRRIA